MTTPLESVLLTPLADIAAASRTTPWDAVVAGGGTAGITAARTLAEAGRRVAVLEAGPLVLLTHSTTTDLRFDRNLLRGVRQHIDYSPKLAGGGTFGTLIGCVGGRGLFWNGASPRYRPEDFAAWPIATDEMNPFYAWAERDFRVSRDYGGGPLCQTVCRILRRAGFEAEPGPLAIDTRPTRDGWIGGTVANAVASLIRTGLLTRADKPIRLSARSFARRILLDSSNTAVRGIEAVDRATGERHEVLGASVVLGAGALESARLALASKVPDRSGLVGRMVSDHFFCRAYYVIPPELYDRERPEAAIVFVPATGTARYQLEIHLPGTNLFLLEDDTRWQPARNADYAAMVRSFGPVASRPDNHIEINGTDGPGSYVVHFTYADDDLALRDEMLAAMERVRVALGADPADTVTLPPGGSYHEAGGLVMGTDPSRSVTDPFGRFHQVRGFVAVDASTWPKLAAANPHLTIAALSRRQATQLAKDLQGV